jgi:hypothetical protein
MTVYTLRTSTAVTVTVPRAARANGVSIATHAMHTQTATAAKRHKIRKLAYEAFEQLH